MIGATRRWAQNEGAGIALYCGTCGSTATVAVDAAVGPYEQGGIVCAYTVECRGCGQTGRAVRRERAAIGAVAA